MNGPEKRVCVVGAGLSGLAAIRGLTRAGHEVTCFEAGSAIGGMWRYDNDNGRSAAYASSFPAPSCPAHRGCERG